MERSAERNLSGIHQEKIARAFVGALESVPLDRMSLSRTTLIASLLGGGGSAVYNVMNVSPAYAGGGCEYNLTFTQSGTATPAPQTTPTDHQAMYQENVPCDSVVESSVDLVGGNVSINVTNPQDKQSQETTDTLSRIFGIGLLLGLGGAVGYYMGRKSRRGT